MKGHLCTPLLWLLLLTVQDTAGADELRLADGGSPCAGRVEVKHEDQWGTVCDFNWDMEDAGVVCKQLGCGSAVSAPGEAHFGPGSGQIWLASVACDGTETALWHCRNWGWGVHYCDHREDAGVTCSGHIKPRLVGGHNACSGRVEITDGETWTTVCDEHFDLKAASVICNALQCGTALAIPGGAHFGKGHGPIWTEKLQCEGNESHIAYCPRILNISQTCSHAKDAGAICTQHTGFRLVNGSSACSGRVEIQVHGAWGTVCDSRWDLQDANVLCHQLDCGFAVSAPGGEYFGKGTGSVWTDTFHCKGTEAHLGYCPVTALGASQCSHNNDAGVNCSGRRESLRLWNGESRCDGRVEISLRGVWGRVLDDQWDMNDASVVCRQLHCGVAEKAYNPPMSEQGTGPVGLRRVQCAGNEANLTLCNISTPETAQAGIAEDVGVVCSGSRQIRLVDGAGRCAGRVEIYYNGTWGTVCDDSWELPDSNVVCKQLGCGHAINATVSAHYGQGSGPIWLDDVNCSGNETSLWECPSRGWGQHNCRHKEDTGVLCSEFTDLRLVDGSDCAGRLEVFYNGSWGSVCSSPMDAVTMALICKHLDCGDAGNLLRNSLHGSGSGPTWVDGVQCKKQHSSLWQCPSDPWKPQSCSRAEETHLSCQGRKGKPPQTPFVECPNSTSCTDKEKLRVVGGEDSCSGRVEVWHRGSWGTVCDDSWDLADANIVCKQLGCGSAVSAPGEAAFGEGTGPIWVEKVNCRGTESSLWDCPATPWGESNCGHKEDAAVNCSGDGLRELADLRLADGGSPCAGRVEVKHEDQWGTVCSDVWDMKDAGVVCKQLGCGSAVSAPGGAYFGEGSGEIWLDDVDCRGTETDLWHCRNGGWGVSNCDHREDAGVTCSGHIKPRLVGGYSACLGRVEIRDGEAWTTVCDDHFDLKAATVICTELQCGTALAIPGGAHFGKGHGPIWTEKLQFTALGASQCSHDNDASVNCSGSRQIRLVDGAGRCAGRVEIYYNGTWGSVCDDSWELPDSNVVCKQLGCGHAINATVSAHHGPGSGPIWLDDVNCSGNETSLWECPSRGWGQHNCRHKEDAGVLCSDGGISPGADELRLADGGSPCAGRVEVKHEDQWGTVCDDDWDMEDAEVVCKQLGCGSAVSAHYNAHFGAGSGPIWLLYVACDGTEPDLWHCRNGGWAVHNCNHREDAGVTCSEHIKPRLVGGDTACSGRVEIKHGNTWTTVCDASFDLNIASVICNELECGTALSTPGGAHFGEGEGLIWTEEFQCVGNESLLFSCPRIPQVNQTCSHAKDAAVTCSRHTGFRLVNGSSACSGRVEIQVHDAWGTVCDSRWDLPDANVLCHQLDCGFAVSAPGGGYFGKGTGSVWTDTFHCKGTEPHLGYCPVTALGASECSHDNDASVNCSGRWESLRLWNGESRCDGRVEISLHGAWGRVLDDQWDMNDASVVCRQLKCGVAEKAYNLNKSEQGTGPVGLRRVQCAGNEANLTLCNISTSETAQAGIAEDVGVVCSGSGPIWLDDVNCSGNESDLWQCPSRGWGWHNCRHKEDVGVLCSEFMDLRLVGISDCAGRLEVFYNGTWGSVCSNQMTRITATIVCKQLKCGDGGQISRSTKYGKGPTWLDHVACREQHSSLWQCPSKQWDPNSCDNRAEETRISCHGQKVKPTQTLFVECPNSTSCTDKEKLRVVEGEDSCSGRVEVWHRGSWGTVCDDSWDLADANVVCKQLGCGSAVSAPGEAAFGEGTGPIWVEKVNCRGTESSLWHCPATPWGESNCGHKEDAAVNCSGVTETTASPTTTAPPHGRVMVPVVVCIILGALLCFVLIVLGAHVRSARAQRRDSRRPLDPFLEAVYEEIDYNLMREKQEMFSRSVSYSDDSVTKLQYYTGDSEEESEPESEQEGASPGGSQLDYDDVEEPALNDVPQTPDNRGASALPADVTGDGYDDAREVSDPEDDPVWGQNDEEGPGTSDRNRDSHTGWHLHSLRSEGISGMEKETQFLPPGDTDYDDVGHGD
ncbi:scavenger receptor cysteine-rich type 1 protein M130-like [Emydura macquarii macquarii]|uniref:scavenger receptor cysteine-rich type 1 protein M130-like n=1 Tax=Emydura macquarii macquarii TaxID=1129001 RepID=UPI00352A2505